MLWIQVHPSATVSTLNICTKVLRHHWGINVVFIDSLLHLTSLCPQLQFQKTQYLQLGPNRGQYYGGSLPNVNQIGNVTVDVTFQVRTVWHLLCLCPTLQGCEMFDVEDGESGVALSLGAGGSAAGLLFFPPRAAENAHRTFTVILPEVVVELSCFVKFSLRMCSICFFALEKKPSLLHFPLSVFCFELCNDRCRLFLQAVCRKLELFTSSVCIAQSFLGPFLCFF